MNVPLTLLFTNNVTNSQLQILFISVVDNARVSGVQVTKIADVFSDTDGIPDWWRLAYFGHALGEASDESRGSDDADGDGVSNLTEYLNGTNPLNPASFPTLPPFHITQISVTASNVQIGCSTVTNWSFQLESSGSLDAWLILEQQRFGCIRHRRDCHVWRQHRLYKQRKILPCTGALRLNPPVLRGCRALGQ